MTDPTRTAIELRPREVLRAAAIAAGVLAGFLFLWETRSIAIVALLGVLVGIVLSAAAGWLERLRIPRPIGAPLVLVVSLAILAGVGLLMAPTLREQTEELQRRLPEVLERFERRFGMSGERVAVEVMKQAQGDSGGEGEKTGGREGNERAGAAPAADGEAGGLRRAVGDNLRHVGNVLFPVATAAIDAVTGIVILLFVGLFLAVAPRLYVEGLLHLVAPEGRSRARRVLEELGDALRQWMVARLLAMIAVGLVVGLTMAALEVRAAALLGVIAGLLEFVPFFGPIAAAVPAVGMALLDGPEKALWVVVAFIVIQQLEGNLLTPLLLKNRVDIPPALTILAVPALMLVFGLSGALIAEPVVAIVLVLVRELWVERG